jgi:low temperature requirement protein LtrA
MASTPKRSITSPEDQSATFVELFFDLVFVFSVTQIVSLLHDGLDLQTVGGAILIFWMVWWAWTQFTWTLNAADTTHPAIDIGTLIATAVAFLMAVALPDAFGERGIFFALLYVLVRSLGLILYVWVSWSNPAQRLAVRNFGLLSIGGMVAVIIGGAVGGSAQYVIWVIAIILDVIAAAIGGQSEHWYLHPDHFTERHGLFVIIALGEVLIVAASGFAGVEWTNALIAAAIFAVALTCGLWWSYFPRAKPALDHALESCEGSARSKMARDAFSLLHFPMLCGLIAYAAAVEEVILHPADPLPLEARVILAVGLVLFVGGLALSIWRASGRLLVLRLAITLATAVIVVLVSGVAGWVSLAIAFVGLLVVVIAEELTFKLPSHEANHEVTAD